MAREVKDELLPEQAQPEVAERQINPIQFQFDSEQEKTIVDIVIQDYDSSVDARNQKEWGGNEGEEQDWDEKYGALIRLYEDQKKARPEKWMANRGLRMAMAIVETMFAKLYPAIWDEEDIKWKPVEWLDEEKAERISKLMKWVVAVQMKLRNVVKTALKSDIKLGTVVLYDKWVTKYKDKGRMESTPIPLVDEMGQPILDQMGQPQMIPGEPKPVIDKEEYCKVDLLKLDRVFIQPGQTDIQEEPIILKHDFYYSDLELMEMQGDAVNIQNLLKEQVDNEIESEMDKALSEAEKISKRDVRRRNYPLDILEWFGPYDGNGDGFAEECVFMIDYKTKTYISGYPLSAISKRAKRPLTKIGFLEREHAFYWIGILEQGKTLFEELDASLNQLIDANTQSIMRWGFYDPTGDYEPETHVAKPRAMYPVRNPSKSVYFPDMQIPIERLINAIRLILEFIERLTAASSYVMGKESEIVGGSGTATRTQAIMQAANERYAAPAENIREGICEVLTNILCQYQMHIPQGMESRILGEKGEKVFMDGELTAESINGELDAYITPSASFGNKNAELEIANWVYSNLMQNPLVAPSMERVYKVTANVLEKMGEEPVFYLGQPPYSKKSDDPEDEHTMMRQGMEVHPLPQEQHIHHLMQHTQKMQDPEMILWSQESKNLLQSHIQATQMMLSQLMQMAMKGGAGGLDMGGQAGANQAIGTAGAEPGKGISETGVPSPTQNQQGGVTAPATPMQ